MSWIRRFMLGAVLLPALIFAKLPTARADNVDMSDNNTYWQVAENPTPPDPQLDYNTYWAEVQAKQEWQDRQ